MHYQETWCYLLPALRAVPQLLQNPQEESGRHVDIVPEVADEVAGPDVVDDMEQVSPAEELVPQGAGNPFSVVGTRIFRPPDGHVRLSSVWFPGQEVHYII